MHSCAWSQQGAYNTSMPSQTLRLSSCCIWAHWLQLSHSKFCWAKDGEIFHYPDQSPVSGSNICNFSHQLNKFHMNQGRLRRLEEVGWYLKAVPVPSLSVPQGNSIQMGAMVLALPVLQASHVQTPVQKLHNHVSTDCACKGYVPSSPGLCWHRLILSYRVRAMWKLCWVGKASSYVDFCKQAHYFLMLDVPQFITFS